MEEIINRVAQSALITLDLDDYLSKEERVLLDIKPSLFQGLILREKDFRIFVKSLDLDMFRNKNVGIYCSGEAIIPTWAYMILASQLSGIANYIALGREQELERVLIDEAVKQIAKKSFEGAKVVIKGCGEINLRDYAYVQVTKVLTPKVSSIMYGEPCSTVPVYKKKISK